MQPTRGEEHVTRTAADKLVSCILAVVIGTVVTACASFGSDTNVIRVHGMVSDGQGTPVRDAEIVIAGVDPVYTDIRGRFVVANVPVGRTAASVRHPEYRAVETEIVVTGPSDVVHVRLQSRVAASEAAVESIVAAAAQREFAAAFAVLSALDDYENDPRLILLGAVVLWRLGRVAEARLEIERLERFVGSAPVVSALRDALKEETE